MENHVFDLIDKSFKYFDEQKIKYNKYLEDTMLLIKEKRIVNYKSGKDIDSKLKFQTENLGLFNYRTNIFHWSWSLPYVSSKDTTITRELLNYGLKLEPQSNTIIHFFLKSLLTNARNYIESDFDLELIQAISSYILKDKYNFIYPSNVFDENKNLLFTTYILVKISSNN